MLKEKYEKQFHTIAEELLIDEHLYCDECGKEIEDHKDYYELTTGHNDWGNDSWESRQEVDICSGDCLLKKLHSYIHITEGKVASDYFKVEHKRYSNRVERRKEIEARGTAIRRV